MKLVVPRFPAASRASQVTFVEPTGKRAAGLAGGEQAIAELGNGTPRSDAVTSDPKLTIAPVSSVALRTIGRSATATVGGVTSPIAIRTGGSLSGTVAPSRGGRARQLAA